MSEIRDEAAGAALPGRRVALVGKFGGMPQRALRKLIRSLGGIVVDRVGPDVDLVVIGANELPLDEERLLDESVREAAVSGKLEILGESQLWQRLGQVDEEPPGRLYTPAMLAELLDLPIAIVRRWHRRGLIVPVHEVHRLPYFDFREVATARQLARLLAAGVSPDAIEQKLARLARCLPDVERPLAQLSIIVEGKHLLLRQGEGLLEPSGQLRIDFDALSERGEQAVEAAADPAAAEPAATMSVPLPVAAGPTASQADEARQLLETAARLEEEGQLQAAAEWYRASLAAGGPRADTCFQLAELLYRLGDATAARERYYMAIELDEDYVEARANLGCVLAECDQPELAVAAFEGALRFHPDYADVHYHLARTLDECGRGSEAEYHWREFRKLAPNSPWSDQARSRLESDTQEIATGTPS